MSKWPHACPGASQPARHPDLTGHEAVSSVSIGYSLGRPPLPRIQHGESPRASCDLLTGFQMLFDPR